MSFRNALISTDVEPLYTKLDIQNAVELADSIPCVDHATPKRLQQYCELPTAYQQLAWNYLNNLTQAVVDITDQSVRQRHVDLLEASKTGVAVMVRFLSTLPDIYVAYRDEFEGMPEKITEQAEELGEIAERSNGFIRTVAAERIAVSGSIERAQHLRGDIPRNPLSKMKQSSWNFLLRYVDDGLMVTPRFDVANQISAVDRNYKQDMRKNDEPIQKKVGCLALIMRKESGSTVFDDVWKQLVEAAVNDDRLFQHDISSLRSKIAEYR